MPLPEPHTGLVIRYSYLWRSEAERGQEDGRKDRPCAVVLASRRQATGQIIVVVAPITHSEPIGDPQALEIPAIVKRRLGLDEHRSWIIIDDLNSFVWPGPDLWPIDPRMPDAGFIYGHLPETLAKEMVRRIRARMEAGAIKLVQRTS